MAHKLVAAIACVALTYSVSAASSAVPSRAVSAKRPLCALSAIASPRAVIQSWIRSYAAGFTDACRLTPRSYRPTTPPFGLYRSGFAERLRSQPGHRLYEVILVGTTRIGRYVVDLVPSGRRWLVDLWAEL